MKAYYLVFFIVISLSNSQINVAVASNVQPLFNSIINDYKNKEDINLIYGSSGHLYHQILSDAPIDVFFSADSIYPKLLAQKNPKNNTITNYAIGQLIFVSKNYPIRNTFQDIKNIVIADTSLAPYGLAAKEYLKQTNMTFERIIYALNIAQVNSYIIQNSVDAGITSKSFLNLVKMPDENWIDIADSLHSEIKQSYIILKSSKKVDHFIQYFNSDKVQGKLIEFGYKKPSALVE